MSELAINAGTSQTVIDTLHNQGFQFQTRMELQLPEMPIDITELPDDALMQLFSELTAYANFISAQFACAMIDERNAESAIEFLESKTYIESYENDKKGAVSTMKARMNMDPEVRHLREAFSAKYAYRKLIEVMVNNVERNTQLVSRELTRRTSNGPTSRANRMFP